MKGIADTGFLVAFGKRGDRYHEWAVGLAARLTEPLLTCDGVLMEAAFHLRDSSAVLAMVTDGLVYPSISITAELGNLARLAKRYEDRRPDLADLCLIRLSELNPNHSVITVDVADFRVYRRNSREVIPLIHPPGL